MKFVPALALAFAVASPAGAQIRPPPEATPVEQILAAASPEARQVFAPAQPGGVLHQPSGFRCPRDSGSATLTGVGTDGGAAWCQYTDRIQPVLRVSFIPDAAAGPEPMSKSWCSELPKALNLRVGVGLPGSSRMEGPLVPSKFGTVTVKGGQSPIWSCTWVRAPFDVSDIVISASATRPAGGWTVRIVQTPALPKKGDVGLYSLYDLLRPIVLAAVVTRAAEEGEPKP